ncbi:sigma factor-like helix-turn-helix DNA-binding protein [Anaerosporobacter faecicola]|nr:sigma factor-like helix-turn-helix DNA-binding protein [Anaerosporobacter faecicola]
MYLFYYEELSVREIGEVTKQKESTVKSQLSRARVLLKKELEGKEIL